MAKIAHLINPTFEGEGLNMDYYLQTPYHWQSLPFIQRGLPPLGCWAPSLTIIINMEI